MCVAGPYIYFAFTINAYGVANKPEGFRFPTLFDYWRTLVSAVLCIAAKHFFLWFLPDFYKPYVKKKEDPV